MRQDFNEALDQCLQLLRLGTPVDECLDVFPEHRTRLRPLLDIASRLKQVAPPLPSVDGYSGGRQALLSFLNQMAQSGAANGHGPLSWLRSTSIIYRTAAVGAVVALMGSALTVTTAASPATIASQVRDLFIAQPDPATPVTTLSGHIASLDGPRLRLNTASGTIDVALRQDTIIRAPSGQQLASRDLQEGYLVEVVGLLQAGRSLLAQVIDIKSGLVDSSTAQEENNVDDEQPSLQPANANISTATPAPTTLLSTSTGSSSGGIQAAGESNLGNSVNIRREVNIGAGSQSESEVSVEIGRPDTFSVAVNAEVDVTPTADGGLQVQSGQNIQVSVGQSTLESWSEVTISGSIRSASTGLLLVSDTGSSAEIKVSVLPDTHIEVLLNGERLSNLPLVNLLRPGIPVEIKGRQLEDGTIRAQSIKVKLRNLLGNRQR